MKEVSHPLSTVGRELLPIFLALPHHMARGRQGVDYDDKSITTPFNQLLSLLSYALDEKIFLLIDGLSVLKLGQLNKA